MAPRKRGFMFGFGWLKRFGAKKVSAELVTGLNKFLTGHANHKVMVVKDIVMVRCTQCNEAFTSPADEWAGIMAAAKSTPPGAKTIDVPVSKG